VSPPRLRHPDHLGQNNHTELLANPAGHPLHLHHTRRGSNRHPQLLGNGKGPTELALTGIIGLTTAAALTLLKPLATAACLRSGATGGLLTPSLASGALLGVTAGQIWQNLWPGGQLGAFAFITAGAMLAVTQRAPLCAFALILEFTHTGYPLLVPLMVAVTTAFATSNRLSARQLDRDGSNRAVQGT
jgi:H+/Cl- antiporter ClcA